MPPAPPQNHFELWHQCREMLESVPAAEWETLTPDQKRRAGILGDVSAELPHLRQTGKWAARLTPAEKPGQKTPSNAP